MGLDSGREVRQVGAMRLAPTQAETGPARPLDPSRTPTVAQEKLDGHNRRTGQEPSGVVGNPF
jgi:hypothetical protein